MAQLLLLSGALSSSTLCRFIPALSARPYYVPLHSSLIQVDLFRLDGHKTSKKINDLGQHFDRINRYAAPSPTLIPVLGLQTALQPVLGLGQFPDK